MNFNYYLWLYSLAEALALSVVVAAIFGFKWWGLRKQSSRLEHARKEVLARLDREIAGCGKYPPRRLELREGRIACFKALSAPFQVGKLGEAGVWREVLDDLGRSFDKLAQAAPPSPPPGLPPLVTAEESEPAEKAEESDTEEVENFDYPELDTEIDALLSQHERGVATLSANRKVTGDLKRKCEEIRQANQNLRDKLASVAKQEHGGQLQRMLDEVEQSNLDLQQMVFATERHHSNLGPQLDALGQQIRNLQLTIRSYRKSLQKLLLDRDALAQEKKELIKQLEAKTKLAERLNRNYDALRREYTKLYEATR